MVAGFLAATVSGAAGFGGALLRLPMLTVGAGPVQAVPLLTVAQLVGNLARVGEIEHLPQADGSVDVIISTGFIDLSPDKPQLFREAFRVLKTGGRLCMVDVVTATPLSEEVRRDSDLHCGCLAGTSVVLELDETTKAAGFSTVRIQPKDESRKFIKDWAPGLQLEEVIVSALIEAEKV